MTEDTMATECSEETSGGTQEENHQRLIGALSDVITAVASLTARDRRRVFASVDQLLGDTSDGCDVEPARTGDRSEDTGLSRSQPEMRCDGNGLRTFFEKTAAKTHEQRVCVIAHYLREHEGVDSVGETEMIEAYRRLGIRTPSEFRYIFNNASREPKEWLKSAGKGKWQLSHKGDETVRLDLLKEKTEDD